MYERIKWQERVFFSEPDTSEKNETRIAAQENQKSKIRVKIEKERGSKHIECWDTIPVVLRCIIS